MAVPGTTLAEGLQALTLLVEEGYRTYGTLSAMDSTDANSSQLASALSSLGTLLENAALMNAASVCNQQSSASSLFGMALKLMWTELQRALKLAKFLAGACTRSYLNSLKKAWNARTLAREYAVISKGLESALLALVNAFKDVGLVELAASAQALKEHLHEAEYPPCIQHLQLLDEVVAQMRHHHQLTPAEAAPGMEALLGPATPRDVQILQQTAKSLAKMKEVGPLMNRVIAIAKVLAGTHATKPMQESATGDAVAVAKWSTSVAAKRTMSDSAAQRSAVIKQSSGAAAVTPDKGVVDVDRLTDPDVWMVLLDKSNTSGDDMSDTARAAEVERLQSQLTHCSPEVQEVVSIFLWNIATNKAAGQATSLRPEAVPLLALLLRSHIPAVQEPAAGALRILATDHLPSLQTISHYETIPVLAAMVGHGYSPAIQEHAVVLLGHLAAVSAANRVAIAQEGAIPHLVTHLQTSDATMKQHAAAALWNVSVNNKNNKLDIVTAGAIPHLVALLQSEVDPALQEAAAGALQSLAFIKAIAVAIAKTSCLTYLTYLLSSKVPRVQAAAATALAVLASHEGEVDSKRLAGVITSLQGVGKTWRPKPVLVLLRLLTCAGMARAASTSIRILAQSDLHHSRAEIVHAGGIPIMATQLRTTTSASVKTHLAYALWALARADDAYSEAVADAGAVPSLVALLSPDNPAAVQRAAVTAVARMCSHPNISRTITEAGAIPLLAALLSRSGGGPSSSRDPKLNYAVQQEAARALAGLAFRAQANKQAIADAGAIPYLAAMMTSDNPDSQTQALQALAHLAHNSPDLQLMVGSSDVIPRVVELMASFNDSSRLVKAINLIGILALHQNNVGLIGQAGAIPHLVALLDHPRSAERAEAVVALMHLATCSDTNRQEMAAAGAAPTLQTLLTEATQEIVQRAALAVLHYMARNSLARIAVVQCVDLPLLVRLLREHKLSMMAQVHAAGLLGQLAKTDAAQQDAIAEADAIPALTTMLVVGDHELVKAADEALKHIAENHHGNQAILMDLGAAHQIFGKDMTPAQLHRLDKRMFKGRRDTCCMS